METKVNLCRVKVHCLSFMRTIVRTYLLRNSCSKLTAFNQISHFAFLFYEFQRPRLDFSGGSRGGARGTSPPPSLIFRLKWGPKGPKKFFWVHPPPSPLLHRPLDLTDCQAANQREGLSRSWKGYSFNFTHADFSESWSKKMIKGFEISLACKTRVIFFTFLRRAKVI